MNLDRLGQGVQLAANVGVILSILFLAYQIAEQRELMKAQTRTDIASGITELLTSEATDANLANALRRNNDGEELSADDYFLLDRVTRAYFRYWENVHYQYRNGLFDEREFTGLRQAWKRRLGRPRIAGIWCGARKEHSPEFVAELDGLLPAGACDTAAPTVQ